MLLQKRFHLILTSQRLFSSFLNAEKRIDTKFEKMKFRAKSCKIVQNHAKSCQNRAAKVKMIQKRASQGFLDPIQKRALLRSVQLEAVYLEALLYLIKIFIFCAKSFNFDQIQAQKLKMLKS